MTTTNTFCVNLRQQYFQQKPVGTGSFLNSSEPVKGGMGIMWCSEGFSFLFVSFHARGSLLENNPYEQSHTDNST